jgi:uncharacterized phage protein (TIGR02216 family)
MAFGFGVLRLSPRSFWSMTPRELAAAINATHGPVQSATSISRTALDVLMSSFPDGNPQ